MSEIYGVLGLDPDQSERRYLTTIGQQSIYDAVQETLRRYTDELRNFESLFVGETTTNHTERHYLTQTGRLQAMGFAPKVLPRERGVRGHYDVAYPLSEFGDGWGADRVTYAYMTMRDLDRHIDAVTGRDANTMANLIISAILDNRSWTFQDPIHGAITVQPLANGDDTLYPPPFGEDENATANHYMVSGYAPTSISDTNDPYPTLVDAIEHHKGTPTGGSPIVVLIARNLTRPTRENLTNFVPIQSYNIRPGDDVTTVIGLPSGRTLPSTAKVIGAHAESAAYIAEWVRLPPGYMVAIHTGDRAPLKRRVDPADTGLSQNLHIISRNSEAPFESAYYAHRMGYGVGDRLGMVVMQVKASGSYDVPDGMAAAGNYG